MKPLAFLLVFLLFVPLIGKAVDAEHASAGNQGKATFGTGMIAYGGKGPEAWRWEKIRSDRKALRLQRRLTVRVLEVRALQRELRLLEQLNLDPVLAIRTVFGPYSDQAIRVFRCESHLSPHARNGQYLGIAQMGEYARARYGHSTTVLGQARAAYRYFVDAGWGPWECARIVGVL